ncbi:MAG: head-tail joining protein [Candidatus Acidiferrales bacterium]
MPTPSTAPAFGDSDIPALMADMGIAITVGGAGGVGLLDEADQILVQDVNRGEVVATATTLTIQTSAFPNAKIGDAVVANGHNFTVRERLRESDGGLTKLLLGN